MEENPYRTAAPYCAPGEREPAVLDNEAALNAVLDAIHCGKSVYGQSADWWEDMIVDAILNDGDLLRNAIAACINTPQMQEICGEIARAHGGDHADS